MAGGITNRFAGSFMGIGKENKGGLRLPYLILTLLILLVFANSFQNSFVWDDYFMIVNNPRINLPAKEILSIFTKPLMKNAGYLEYRQTYYRPVLSLYFILNYKIWGMNPVGFHLVNLLLYIITVIVLYKIGLILFSSDENKNMISLIGASIFAVHPVNSEVAGRAACGEILLGFFIIFSLYFFLRANKYLSLFAFALALLSKEAAVMLPFALLILAIYRNGLKRGVIAMAPYMAVTGIYLILREISGVASFPYKVDQPIFTRILTICVAIFDYIRLLLVPYPLSTLYPAKWHTSIFEPKVLIAIITLISALLFALKIRRDKAMLFLMMFPFIMLVPVVLLVNRFPLELDKVYIAERFLYVSAIVFPIFVFASAIKFAGNRARAYIVTAGVVIIGIFAVITARSNMIWRNEINLFQRMVRDAPNIASAHNNLGTAYYRRNQLDEAIKEYFIALKLNPNYPDVHNNLGSAYAMRGQLDEAIKEYFIALKLNPNYLDAYNNLGIAYVSQGRLDDAIKEFITALRLRPTYAEAHFNLGEAYYKQERFNEAINEYISTLKLNPDDVKAHYNLGVVYYKQERFNEAINEYTSTLKLNPDDVKAHYNLGVVYYEQGRLNEAINEYILTLKLNPADVKAHYNLGVAYYEQGRLNEAINEYISTLKLNPADVKAHYNLGVAYYKQERFNEAINEYISTLNLNPAHVVARNNLGFSYYLAGNYDAAYQEFQKIVEIDSKFPNTYCGLGLVYKKQGKLKYARKHFEEYLELAPKGPLAGKAREELRELENR